MRKSVLGLLLALTACAPAINPAMKQATDALASRHGSHHLPAPDSYAVQEWKPGSWILWRVTSDGNVSVQKMSILPPTEEGFVVQTETQDYQHRSVQVTTFSRMPRTAEESADLLVKVVQQQDEQAPTSLDFREPGTAMMKGMYKAIAATVSAPADVSGHPKEDVSVAAGTFAGAARYPSFWQWGPFRQDIVSWWHPGVPVNGAVKGQSTDGKFQLELLDFGWSGAKSALR